MNLQHVCVRNTITSKSKHKTSLTEGLLIKSRVSVWTVALNGSCVVNGAPHVRRQEGKATRRYKEGKKERIHGHNKERKENKHKTQKIKGNITK